MSRNLRRYVKKRPQAKPESVYVFLTGWEVAGRWKGIQTSEQSMIG